MRSNGVPPARRRWRVTLEWSEDDDGLPDLDHVLVPVMQVLIALDVPGMIVRPEAVRPGE